MSKYFKIYESNRQIFNIKEAHLKTNLYYESYNKLVNVEKIGRIHLYTEIELLKIPKLHINKIKQLRHAEVGQPIELFSISKKKSLYIIKLSAEEIEEIKELHRLETALEKINDEINSLIPTELQNEKKNLENAIRNQKNIIKVI